MSTPECPSQVGESDEFTNKQKYINDKIKLYNERYEVTAPASLRSEKKPYEIQLDAVDFSKPEKVEEAIKLIDAILNTGFEQDGRNRKLKDFVKENKDGTLDLTSVTEISNKRLNQPIDLYRILKLLKEYKESTVKCDPKTELAKLKEELAKQQEEDEKNHQDAESMTIKDIAKHINSFIMDPNFTTDQKIAKKVLIYIKVYSEKTDNLAYTQDIENAKKFIKDLMENPALADDIMLQNELKKLKKKLETQNSQVIATADKEPKGGYAKKLLDLEKPEFMPKPLDILEDKEILMMDRAIQDLFKTYMHFDFWQKIPEDKRAEAKKAIEDAIQYRNHLWYKEKDGTVEIRKRNGKPAGITNKDFVIKIDRGGKVTQVNDVIIDHRYITPFEKDWENMEERIKNIDIKKIIKEQGKEEAEKTRGRPIIISPTEEDWYLICQVISIKNISKLLELKESGGGNLTDKEKIFKNRFINENTDFPIIIKGNAPKGLFYIAQISGEKIYISTAFSKEGFLFKEKDDEWVKSDDRATPFADDYKRQHPATP